MVSLPPKFPAFLTTFALLGALLLSPSAPAQTAGDNSASSDDTVLAMAQAFRQGDRKRLQVLLPQARGNVLEPWAAYWALSSRLDEATDAEVQDFFARYPGSYQEDRLRVDWLMQQGRNKDWARFSRDYPDYRMQDDRSLRCYALQAAFAAQGADVSAEFVPLWLAQREADDACAGLAADLLAAHKLKPDVIWQRARLGLEFDRLRVATQAVELLQPRLSKDLNALYQNPAKYLKSHFAALQQATRELASLALIRMATQEPADAAAEMDKLRWKLQLTQEERSWLWGVIGKRAAQKFDDQALAYFARGQNRYMHADHLAWATRAALRAGRWDQVRSSIEAMEETQRNEPCWKYWRARALLQSGDASAQSQAKDLLLSMASVRGFYEQLALEDLGQRISPPAAPAPLSAEEREAARKEPGLQRALYAIRIGLRSEGVREWNYTTNLHTPGGMDDRPLLAAAELACSQEVWDRCINTSERTKGEMDFAQRFPMPFHDAVLAQSQKIGLDPAAVYGLIRQESRFVMDARSGVGASGLMQVMPATARWTAKKLGLSNFQPQQLSQRDTNITIGTGYLKLVLDRFDGSLPLAAAAYNAGPNRAAVWRGSQPLDAAIWAENLPFSETRDYVKKVLANSTVYAALITGQPQSLKQRLGQVGPAPAGEVAADLP